MPDPAACIFPSASDPTHSLFYGRNRVDASPSTPSGILTRQSAWVVLKFGGSSVSSVASWENVALVLRDRLVEGLQPLVVHSALSGITDKLEQLVALALHGEWQSTMNAIEDQHRKLAQELGLAAISLEEQFKCLRQVAAGITLIGECSERLRARVLAQGELMATRLGAAFLSTRGLAVEWVDARTALKADQRRNANAYSNYLSASCVYEPDAGLQERWSRPGTVWITQGCIARDANGDTVLLGRNGSDISASYFAAKLQARRLELWTDVPGLFSANPRSIPTARQLRSLHYSEAHEIAHGGAQVLHPDCIVPMQQYQIPLYVYATQTPQLQGTAITGESGNLAEPIKAVTIKKNLWLLSLENATTSSAAQFLVDVLQIFQAHGISADLLSTGETSAVVAVDRSAPAFASASFDSLLCELGKVCRFRVLGPCAAVSLVGRNLHAILHRLGEACALLQKQQLHLVTQAANGLNVRILIDEAHGDWLTARLHEIAIHKSAPDRMLGPTWEELCSTQLSDISAHDSCKAVYASAADAPAEPLHYRYRTA